MPSPDLSPFTCRARHLHDASWCAPRAMRLARRAGFSTRDAAELGIIVSELVTNAVKYAGGGELSVRVLDAPRLGVEITITDEGPGVGDLEAVFADGYSGGHGSLGAGLGAVRRLSDEVELKNLGARGLFVRVLKYARGRP